MTSSSLMSHLRNNWANVICSVVVKGVEEGSFGRTIGTLEVMLGLERRATLPDVYLVRRASSRSSIFLELVDVDVEVGGEEASRDDLLGRAADGDVDFGASKGAETTRSGGALALVDPVDPLEGECTREELGGSLECDLGTLRLEPLVGVSLVGVISGAGAGFELPDPEVLLLRGLRISSISSANSRMLCSSSATLSLRFNVSAGDAWVLEGEDRERTSSELSVGGGDCETFLSELISAWSCCMVAKRSMFSRRTC